jgi:type I restriction enzyme, S subunit
MVGDGKFDISVGELAAPVRNALVGGPFGSDLGTADYVPTGVPVIRGQNLSNGKFVGGEFVYVSEEKADKLRANLARPGDLVFTQRGNAVLHGGQVAIVPNQPFNRYVVSQSQMKLTPDQTKVDSRFLYFIFTSADYRHYLRSNAVVTGVPHINLGLLREYPVSLPSLPEQRAISSVLGTLDDMIELNREINETLEEMARALFKSWFVDFDPVRAKLEGRAPAGMDAATAALFPDHFQDCELGQVPRGWNVQPVGEAVSCVGGGTPSTSEPKFWENGVHHWTTPKDFSSLEAPILIDTDRRITDAGLVRISSGLLPVGTVLMSSRAPVGYLAITEIPVAINQGFIAMRCNESASNFFMLNWCQSNMAEIESRASGTTFAEISKSAFRPIPMIVPPAKVMAAFTEYVEPFYSHIASNLHESRDLATLRDTLLPKLLSGEVSVDTAKEIIDE